MPAPVFPCSRGTCRASWPRTGAASAAAATPAASATDRKARRSTPSRRAGWCSGGRAGRELVIPRDLARLRTDGEDRRGVQVVALALVAVPGPGIAGAPVDEVELRIVRAGNPRARASAQVSLARLPRLVPFVARACGGIAAPELLAGRGIPAVEETARPEFGPGAAGDQHPVRDQRRDGERVAFLPLGHFLFPQLLAGLLVERHHVRVERGNRKWPSGRK